MNATALASPNTAHSFRVHDPTRPTPSLLPIQFWMNGNTTHHLAGDDGVSSHLIQPFNDPVDFYLVKDLDQPRNPKQSNHHTDTQIESKSTTSKPKVKSSRIKPIIRTDSIKLARQKLVEILSPTIATISKSASFLKKHQPSTPLASPSNTSKQTWPTMKYYQNNPLSPVDFDQAADPLAYTGPPAPVQPTHLLSPVSGSHSMFTDLPNQASNSMESIVYTEPIQLSNLYSSAIKRKRTVTPPALSVDTKDIYTAAIKTHTPDMRPKRPVDIYYNEVDSKLPTKNTCSSINSDADLLLLYGHRSSLYSTLNRRTSTRSDYTRRLSMQTIDESPELVNHKFNSSRDTLPLDVACFNGVDIVQASLNAIHKDLGSDQFDTMNSGWLDCDHSVSSVAESKKEGGLKWLYSKKSDHTCIESLPIIDYTCQPTLTKSKNQYDHLSVTKLFKRDSDQVDEKAQDTNNVDQLTCDTVSNPIVSGEFKEYPFRPRRSLRHKPLIHNLSKQLSESAISDRVYDSIGTPTASVANNRREVFTPEKGIQSKFDLRRLSDPTSLYQAETTSEADAMHLDVQSALNQLLFKVNKRQAMRHTAPNVL
ncbi:hypothetical protein BATDEDRAFT_25706 [Batrachochytrium dendrobatidis JAM81]|uniref:Uncharacterized protein n=1 Tax=Batrachochytrium dendrobatidis (strain JAM81 / FGSC 10211) TaxID=684364 RepID=F4P5C9_BATDJ|nr:uncharacterized protein BATDEDRAFT_25706 [Batrachochytrium dendrobatidis JAM81]EGF79171.1 hypothetical protein BATDEDRAFT_25706 [Batrachochytrium dendrobatidis JAM81]|eukprot:XP_006679856.1 hypothetical protein BATDEDRAFT_25706 [Batrachochytrium dendrobatidis JAM81]